MVRLYGGFKKDSEFLKKELTPLQYQTMQHAGIRMPSSLSEERLGKPQAMMSRSPYLYLKQESINND